MDWLKVVDWVHDHQVRLFAAAFGLLLITTLYGC